jgi:ornithine cyclodeaminase/alanine dehydrogenase-like protein (mu-crystallin family)
VSVPVFSGREVNGAISPGDAVDAVRTAFIEHARGAWVMPSKIYVDAPPDGDFRAMPAAGDGHAVLKWVTSFPSNPDRGLPTVSGVVLLSNARTGELEALFDAAAVTALRTGAAAVLAAETLARLGSGAAGVVGCGVNGRAVARTFIARGREVLLHDAQRQQAAALAAELGEGASEASLGAVLACDIVATVTPGREPVIATGMLRSGQHVSLMGADGPGKAEIDLEELLRTRIVCDEWEQAVPDRTSAARVRLFCDDWEQASHGGELAAAVETGRIGREDVTQLGDVLAGTAAGRRSEDDITVFDSTGLAIQDLAVAITVYERWRANPRAETFAGVTEVELG